MTTIGERIKEVRKENGMTLASFGGEIGVSAQAVGNIEKGVNNPSEQTIRAIISCFGVDETWLRTGVGEMYPPKSRKDKISEYVGKLTGGKRTEIEELLVEFMAETSVEEWKVLADMMKRLADKIEKTL